MKRCTLKARTADSRGTGTFSVRKDPIAAGTSVRSMGAGPPAAYAGVSFPGPGGFSGGRAADVTL